MKNEKDKTMNIKIQDAPIGGKKNTGSSRELAEYLGHEDDDRKNAGKEVFPFTTPDGIPVTKEVVIDKIDRDQRHLGKNDTKFFHLIVSPSQDEILAMGSDEQEIYRSSRMLIKHISDAYAQNYHREGIEDSSDLEIFWKPHFTRGANDDLQFHLHAIIRRKSRGVDGKSVKLSPMTNHKSTESGPVKGGFDRNAFYKKCEAIFDNLMQYDRKVSETFEYNNVKAHGSVEEKQAQAELLAKEQMSADLEGIAEGIARRKKAKKDRDDVEEISHLLGKGGLDGEMEKALAISQAAHIFNEATSKLDLQLKLMAAGLGVTAKVSPSGGVDDIIVSHKGRSINSKDTLNEDGLRQMLTRWEFLTGDKPAFKVAAEQAKVQAVKEAKDFEKKVIQVEPPKKKIGRGL